MTKKEFWEKKKYKVGKESWNKCDFCLNQCEWLAYIGDYSYADGAYICEKCFVGNELFIENKEPMNTSKEYIKKICDSAYEEDKEAIDEAIKYLGGNDE